MTLTGAYTAIAPYRTVSFLAAAGAGPYNYAVLPGGAGGTIDAASGVYTAPALASSDPKLAFDTIEATDTLANQATTTLLVGTPLLLFCDILQKELGLANGRAYLWNQKLMQPTDSGLYVAVSVLNCRPYSNILRYAVNGDALQGVNMQAKVEIDIMSRGPDARDRKEEVILAMGGHYSQQQQEANSFYISKLPLGSQFINLSHIDGTAIPYRYKISVAMQYAVTKTKAVSFYDTFADVAEIANA